MLILPDREPRFSGRATTLPSVQDFLDALGACMSGEQGREALQVSYEVAETDGETAHVETIKLVLVTAVEFHPMAEHMVVAGWDDEFMLCVLSLRRNSATGKEIEKYIEIY